MSAKAESVEQEEKKLYYTDIELDVEINTIETNYLYQTKYRIVRLINEYSLYRIEEKREKKRQMFNSFAYTPMSHSYETLLTCCFHLFLLTTAIHQ